MTTPVFILAAPVENQTRTKEICGSTLKCTSRASSPTRAIYAARHLMGRTVFMCILRYTIKSDYQINDRNNWIILNGSYDGFNIGTISNLNIFRADT
jgi:hypothetical protein